MKLNFYKKSLLALISILAFATSKTNAQTQGLYSDTTMWTSSSTVTVKIKSKGFTNVVAFQGTLKFDSTTLQLVGNPIGNASYGASNYSFNIAKASSGIISYIYTDAAANHTSPDGTDLITLNFNVINNPKSTGSDNSVCFANAPTTIGIDTAADVAGLSDLATLYSPALQRHTCGYVSFARQPVLTVVGNDVTDTVTGRPAGCTYQWTVGGAPVAGTSISSFIGAPAASLVCLTITYPNGNSVSCLNAGGGVLPVKYNNFSGKVVEGKSILNWSTAQELNNSGFAIEKSFDGEKFNQVGFVKANASKTYSFAEAFQGTVYYRLKQIDNNGSFTYSTIIKLNGVNNTKTNVYPNPAKASVNVSSENINKIEVADVMGRKVIVNNYNGLNNVSLNISSLSKGVYYATIITNNTKEVVKLLVD